MTLPTISFRPGRATGALPVSLDRLIESKLLVQANSGGGKSWAVRYLLEQTHGRVQHIVLDREGEFATLREKFPYLLVGRDGDVPASRDELHARVMAKLSTGQQKILGHLLSVYPEVLTRSALSEAVSMSLNGGSGAQNVADLVTLGAVRIPGKGKVVASDLLFPEGL